MSVSWKALCREAGIRLEEGAMRIPCGNGRFQQVWVDESTPTVLRLWSQVATRSQLRHWNPRSESVEMEAWLINRYRELVGFKHNERGVVIGEAWVPMIEITAEEWRIYVETIAKACDRLEYLWTGIDR